MSESSLAQKARLARESAAATAQPAAVIEEPKQRKAKKSPVGKAVDVQKMPPHAPEAELAICSSIMFAPADAILECNAHGLTEYWFYVPAYRTFYIELKDMWDSGAQKIDMITFADWLESKGLLASVGGRPATTELQLALDQVFNYHPTIANLSSYIEIVREKYVLREMIALGTHMARAAYSTVMSDELPELLEKFHFRLRRIKHDVIGDNSSQRFDFERLMGFDSKHDPNSLVGNRYLVRGGSSLWAGGSGYGKSSLALQLGVYWATGAPCFGLRTWRPLKSIFVQAENDEGDMGEQLQGVIAGIKATGDIEVDIEKIKQNVAIHRVVGKTGQAFLALLNNVIELERPDIVWIDPLFAFAGCDLLNAEKTGRFLREGLFPMAIERKVALNVMHHVGKPVRDQANNNGNNAIADIDYQYLGFGTSEIQNAFRAVNVLVPVAGSHIFRLVLSKRGERAMARGVDDKVTRSIFLEHSKEGICWLQTTEPTKKNKSRFSHDDITKHMSVTTPVSVAELLKLTRDVEYGKGGMSRSTFFRLWDELQDEKKVESADDGWLLKSHESQQSHEPF